MTASRARASHRDAGAEPPPHTAGGVTRRAILAAFLLLAVLLPVSFYVSIVWNNQYFTSGVPASAQVTVLFLFGAAMGLPLLRRVGLTRRELLVIYCVLLVAAPVVSTGILFLVLPKIVVYYYLARANPSWETIFLHAVPSWYAPTDTDAVESFFVGKARVPWALWETPLAVWLSFLVALFTASTCLLSLIQQQWITHERLSFPIAQIPLDMLRDGASPEAAPARLSRAPALWLGLGASFFLSFLSSLSGKVPAIPAIPLNGVEIIPWQKVGPLAGLGAFDLMLSPWLIGLAYLVPKELSFSCWFFWLVRLALHVAAIAAGASPQRPEEWWSATFPAPYFQGTGAVLALGVWTLWTARRHLARAARAAAGLDRQAGREDPVAPRAAFLGLLLSFAWMLGFCLLSGCRFPFALLLIILILLYFMVWARLRAETGLGFLAFPTEVFDVIITPLGSARWRPREIVTLFSTRWVGESGEGSSLDTVAANLMDAFKIADTARIPKRRLTRVIVAAFLVAVALGVIIMLTGIYRFGYYGTKAGAAPEYPSLQTRWDPTAIAENIASPSPTNTGALLAIVVGAAVTVLLGLLRLRFVWWPFHPIGYLAANCWGWNLYSVPFFIGWAAKNLSIRYGGLRLYRALMPVAVGLIIGNMLNSFLWSMVTFASQGHF